MEDGHFNLEFEEAIPSGGGTSNFNELNNRPKVDGVEMTGDTNIVIPTKTSDLTNDSDFVDQDALETLEHDLQQEIAEKQEQLTAGENIKTLNNTSILGSGNITTNKVVEIGNGQYTYQGYVLPTISATIARQIYTDDQAGISQVLHWSIYGTDNNLKVVSSDHIGTEYSIDVLVHNKYHCAYAWTDQTTGDIEPTVETSQHITIAQETGQSTEAVMSQKAITDALASGGGITFLTAADHNYPEASPNGVAMWLLPDGIYMGNANIYPNKSDSRGGYPYFTIVTYENNKVMIWYHFDDKKWMYSISQQNGTKVSSAQNITPALANNLTTTAAYKALDARQGKILKDLIDSLIIKGSGAPTTSTVGTVGKLYEDTTNGDLYQCTAVSGSTYTWEEIGSGGGVNVVQTTGTSATDVMSQDAVTKMIYPYNGDKQKIIIGDNITSENSYRSLFLGYGIDHSSYASPDKIVLVTEPFAREEIQPQGSNQIIINAGGGSNASRRVMTGAAAVAIGNDTLVSGDYSIALGAKSTATTKGEFSIGGSSLGTNGYNNTNYRLLTGVHDGVNAHDACTKGQLDAALAQIQALEARIAALEGNA